MAIESELRAILTGDPVFADLVGNRIYPSRIAADVVRPAGAYRVISRDDIALLGGEISCTVDTSIQYTWAADTYAQVRDTADAARAVLHGLTERGSIQVIFLENEYGSFGDTNDIYILRQDYIVTHTES